MAFEARANVNTLAHTDVYHGHVFKQDGRAVVIDWGQARYAPLFLDLGDTFDTPEAAQVYREALEGREVRLDNEVFRKGHLLARRFAGVRYLWWWLESWRHEPQGWNRDGLERALGMAARDSRLWVGPAWPTLIAEKGKLLRELLYRERYGPFAKRLYAWVR